MDDRFKNKWAHWGMMAAIYITGTMTLFSHVLAHGLPKTVVGVSCPVDGVTRTLEIGDHGFNQSVIQAKRCDRLTITSTGNAPHLIALGQQYFHISYPGFAEKLLGPGRSLSFSLSVAGTYAVHDHLDEKV